MSNAHAKKTAAKAKGLNKKQSNQIDVLLLVLREFQSIDAEFPLQYALCLLEIAQDEGLSLTTLAERTSMPLSTISRIIGALSEHRQRGEPYRLVEVKLSENSRRLKEITLTPKGRKIVERLALITQTLQ